MPKLELTLLVGGCGDTNICPAISTTNRGTVTVQGIPLQGEELAAARVPDGEEIVEIPLALIEEAARALRR